MDILRDHSVEEVFEFHLLAQVGELVPLGMPAEHLQLLQKHQSAEVVLQNGLAVDPQPLQRCRQHSQFLDIVASDR
jgi:hypothetical protein